MSDNYTETPRFVQRLHAWVLLPIGGYLVAAPFLGPGSFFVPIVITNAPAGILMWFHPIGLSDIEKHTDAMAGLHLLFWSLWIVGMSGREKLPVRWLHGLWCFLVIMLLMSISGCAYYLGPGLRSDGNWH